MRPKHNRHPYKGTKFRKRYPTTNSSLYVGWMEKYFLPKYLSEWPYREGFIPNGKGGRLYKIYRKLYNAHYKALRREHKRNGGFCIGDEFWNIIK